MAILLSCHIFLSCECALKVSPFSEKEKRWTQYYWVLNIMVTFGEKRPISMAPWLEKWHRVSWQSEHVFPFHCYLRGKERHTEKKVRGIKKEKGILHQCGNVRRTAPRRASISSAHAFFNSDFFVFSVNRKHKLNRCWITKLGGRMISAFPN